MGIPHPKEVSPLPILGEYLRRPNNPNCELCELHEQAKSVCVPTIELKNEFPLHMDTVFFIGQNPGFHEDENNEPFVGRPGLLVRTAYIHGINLHERANIHLGNGVRCHIPTNEAPKPRHYRACMPYLREDLLAIFHQSRMNIVITLGAPVTSAFYKEILGISRVRLTEAFAKNGDLHKIIKENGDPLNFHVFSTYHPSAVLRNNNHINAVHSHMQLVSDCLNNTMAKPSKPNIKPTRSPNP